VELRTVTYCNLLTDRFPRRYTTALSITLIESTVIPKIVGPILAQREAYVDLWCSCQIGDAYIDLSNHLFDTYTRSKVNAAPPLNPNPTPRDDRTRNSPWKNMSP